MLPRVNSYDELVNQFRWNIPKYFNMGFEVCDRWAEKEPNRIAIIDISGKGKPREFSYGKLTSLSNQLANLLTRIGIKPGDRTAVLLPQTVETALSHIATFKLGGISIPLFTLFGIDALQFRIENAGIKVIVTDISGAEKLNSIRHNLPNLEHVLVIDGEARNSINLYSQLPQESDQFEIKNTLADDPALITYTSGTTGQPKGALHAHRSLLGHLPGVEMSHYFFPQTGDIIWTPADWAWIGGLMDVLMPALYHGVPVVACRFKKFTAEAAFELIEKYQIRNMFLPPTALKIMRTIKSPEKHWNMNVRTIASAGETLGTELLEWGKQTFGVSINEFYGQTECNMIVSACAEIMPAQPGIMGRAAPGHNVEIINNEGEILPDNELGQIAVYSPDPVMFLGYWNNSQATKEKFLDNWLLTGDIGFRTEDGWLKFVGRDDDVITSSGYRIGPGEIEDCLIKHPAVAFAAVIGKPDPGRTEIVKAFIVLKDQQHAGDKLKTEIQGWVKVQLAAHEYPREIEFVNDLPMTTTGKIIRRKLRDYNGK